MEQQYEARHATDDNDMPAGGFARATGIDIVWQNGPLGRGTERKEPNGAFVETLIAITINRIEFYQTAKEGQFKCEENEIALDFLRKAHGSLQKRTQRREQGGVEGTHEQAGGDGEVLRPGQHIDTGTQEQAKQDAEEAQKDSSEEAAEKAEADEVSSGSASQGDLEAEKNPEEASNS